jgi:Na+-transporting NADH:ubiquinone oxidoreductase subunit C
MKEKLFTLVFMVAIASVFTGGVAAVYVASRGRVKLNQDLVRKKVIMRVLGMEVPRGAGLEKTSELYDQCVRKADVSLKRGGEDYPIYVGTDPAGRPLGYCFETSGRGFWDIVRGYVAVSPDLKTIKGLAFFKQNETPGLGAEITKPWFEAQFRGRKLPADIPESGPIIRLVPQGAEKGPHDVDAVTGASGTSNAVERFLNDDLRAFLDTMRARGEGGRDA